MFAFKIFVTIFISSLVQATTYDESETSIFCYGRLLHDVQVQELFPRPRDFLELWATKPSQVGIIDLKVIAAEYRKIRPKLKLKQEASKELLKGFIRGNFVNRSCYVPVSPPDWRASLPFSQEIRTYRTYELLRIANRKWHASYYNMTAEARESLGFHSSLRTKHPFYGSISSLDYSESWWLFQGLLASGMLTSAKQLIENICGLIEDIGHVPIENRVFSVGRSGPPFVAIMLEAYFNATGDSEIVGRLLPYAELDFHYWIQLSTKKVSSAWDVLLVVSHSKFSLTRPRPERYFEDWKRKMNFTDPWDKGNSIASLIWDSEPPRGVVAVMLTSVTEWSARVLSRLTKRFGGLERAPMYLLISTELAHTLDVLLYNRKSKQWMDYTSRNGHIGDVSLWPVYTGLFRWQDHYQVPTMSTLEEVLVAASVLLKAEKTEAGRKLTSAALSELQPDVPLSLKDSALIISLLKLYPGAEVTYAVAPTVHTQIALIAIPMLITTIVFIPFIFVKVHISG